MLYIEVFVNFLVFQMLVMLTVIMYVSLGVYNLPAY